MLTLLWIHAVFTCLSSCPPALVAPGKQVGICLHLDIHSETLLAYSSKPLTLPVLLCFWFLSLRSVTDLSSVSVSITSETCCHSHSRTRAPTVTPCHCILCIYTVKYRKLFLPLYCVLHLGPSCIDTFQPRLCLVLLGVVAKRSSYHILEGLLLQILGSKTNICENVLLTTDLSILTNMTVKQICYT